MIQRITTNGMMNSYKTSLMKSYNTLADASEKVTTERKFNSYAENPTKASQAFQLRRNRWNTENQIANSKQVVHKYKQAWDCLNTTYDNLGNKLARYSALRAENGADYTGRPALGEVIKGAARSVVETMNAKYGDNFVFSGADGKNVPFEMDADGNVYYRGVEVSTFTDKEGKAAEDSNGNKGEAIFENMIENEHTYVDLGMGMKENNGEIIPSSAFDTALFGVDMIGYGTSKVTLKDGKTEVEVPKNVISIMYEMGSLYAACSPEDGTFSPDSDGWTKYDNSDLTPDQWAEALEIKLNDAMNDLHAKWISLDTDSTYLESNQERLTSLDDSLNEQIVDVEDIDPADAITSLMWAQYSYNAALRIGMNILSQSLLDYMS